MFGIPSLDPYSAAINIGLKVGGVALIAILLVGGYYEIKALKAEAKTIAVERDTAMKERDSAIRYADAIVENQIVVEELMRAHEITIQKLQVDLKNKKKVIYAVKTSPVTQECKAAVADFFAPIGTALRMLRQTPEAGLSPAIEVPKIDLSIGARPAIISE